MYPVDSEAPLTFLWPDETLRPDETRPFGAGAAVVVMWRSAVGDSRSVPAEVKDVTTWGVAIFMSEALVGGQTVSVRWDDRKTKAVVRHCERRATGFLVVLRFLPFERRKEDRLATDGHAVLRWVDGSGVHVKTVWVKDATPGGLQVETEQPLAVRQAVRVSGAIWDCGGHVRYSVAEGEKFIVGIQFSEPPSGKFEAVSAAEGRGLLSSAPLR